VSKTTAGRIVVLSQKNRHFMGKFVTPQKSER